MNGFLMLVLLTPLPAFLSLAVPDRLKLLQNIAAPLQEWTGADGGVCFSERFQNGDDSAVVVVGVTLRSQGLAEAFGTALSSSEFTTYFSWTELHGEILGIHDLNDGDEAQRVLARTLQPFLEL